jgi:molybdopterin/thiamine biosynthesis adenylyltransferase
MTKIDIKKSRFRDADWFERLDKFTTPIVIGGAGGIGSWLTLLLSRVINPNTNIYLYDFDSVEEINIAGQLYKTSQIGKYKVDAVSVVVREFSGYNKIVIQNEKYTKNSLASPVMFSAFDNMQARKDMFNNWKKEAYSNPLISSIFIDGRLLAEQLQVFFVTPDRIPLYEKYLFDDKEIPDQSCSYKQTSHFAAAIAAKMIQGFTNWLAGDTAVLPFYYEEIGSMFLTGTKDE